MLDSNSITRLAQQFEEDACNEFLTSFTTKFVDNGGIKFSATKVEGCADRVCRIFNKKMDQAFGSLPEAKYTAILIKKLREMPIRKLIICRINDIITGGLLDQKVEVNQLAIQENDSNNANRNA